MTGRLPQRLRLGPLELDKYLAGQLQGMAYMRRLRAIEDEEQRHVRELEQMWTALAEEVPDAAAFAADWRDVARYRDFRRLNDLIERHNEHYPVEASVPMNPRTGGYAVSWRREPYDQEWVLERFPPDVTRARAARAANE